MSETIHQPQLSVFLYKSCSGAGEMAQKLRALAALPEVLSSSPSSHMGAHKDLVPSSGMCMLAELVYMIDE